MHECKCTCGHTFIGLLRCSCLWQSSWGAHGVFLTGTRVSRVRTQWVSVWVWVSWTTLEMERARRREAGLADHLYASHENYFLDLPQKQILFYSWFNLAFLFPLTPGTQQEASEVPFGKVPNGSPAGAQGQWNGPAERRGQSCHSVWSGQTGKERYAGITHRENWSPYASLYKFVIHFYWYLMSNIISHGF